jgi:ABC-type bacteriocin/lantibiotic exporter with double-glycine peptidase domain
MNVPHFQQELDYSCLAACVRMVLAFYGSTHTESELRGLLKTRPGGTSPANVLFRLPSLGFTAELPDASLSYLREQVQAEHPCIVHVWTPPLPHWKDEAIHALVVCDVTQETVWVNDPVLSSGPTAIPREAFVRAWAATGYVALVITLAEK